MLNSVAALIISIYAAAFIYMNAFFVKQLTVLEGSSQLFWNHLGVFLIILLPIFFLMKRLVSFSYTRGGMRYVRVFVLSLALLGLVISLLYHIIPAQSVYDFPGTLDKAFGSGTAFTVWLILPLVALFI